MAIGVLLRRGIPQGFDGGAAVAGLDFAERDLQRGTDLLAWCCRY
jgi:hypothetical protein